MRARYKAGPSTIPCDNCGNPYERVAGGRNARGRYPPCWACRACELYDATVAARQAAAQSIATARFPGAKDAWLNALGIWAWVDDECRSVGTPEEAAPFVALVDAARKVSAFWSAENPPGGVLRPLVDTGSPR